MVSKVLILAVMLALGGCATMPVQVGLPCNVGPFTPDKGASTRWTRNEKEQLVVLNDTGERYCRWKPAN